MSGSDKDNTFVKNCSLKFEVADIYIDTVSLRIYLGRIKFAFQIGSGYLLVKVKSQIFKKFNNQEPTQSIYKNSAKTQKAMPIENLPNVVMNGPRQTAVKYVISYR